MERGYNLYEANCARCHGDNGEGGIGPVLNDQAKLFAHLSEQYIRNVLTVGGRYVCGNSKSLMPVWADTNGGPLNYIQIEDLIAFIRAPSTQEYTRRDPRAQRADHRRGRQGPDVQGLARHDVQAGAQRDARAGLLQGRPAAARRRPRRRRCRRTRRSSS